jgi:hypothetical protein
MRRGPVITASACCLMLGTCALSEHRHAVELREIASRYEPPPRTASAIMETPAHAKERIRRTNLQSTIEPGSKPARRTDAQDLTWEGIHIQDVPKDRVLRMALIEQSRTETRDTGCFCTGEIRAGSLAAPAPPEIRSSTDFEVKPFGPWRSVMMGSGFFTPGWTAMFDTGDIPKRKAIRIATAKAEELKTRFGLDHRGAMMKSPYGEAWSYVVRFSKPGTDDGRAQSAVLDEVIVLATDRHVLMGVRVRKGVGGRYGIHGQKPAFGELEVPDPRTSHDSAWNTTENES